MNKYLYIEYAFKTKGSGAVDRQKTRASERKKKEKRTAIHLLLCRNIWKVFEGSACELGAMGKSQTPIPSLPPPERIDNAGRLDSNLQDGR